ncbi:activating transcription factor 7-interacting protein 2 isoform X3 [Pygocentrus nattereri]|uniref:activating transcription factor 7-interacting protein 2 isoform X3 n=1 Tax=Pygocentrus nattereri TaxID=42514 RepID=UPI001891DF2A|nr:activating transcription factor 7-interacting protein 2 isoform X3 [Pygocentrus nattereri]
MKRRRPDCEPLGSGTPPPALTRSNAEVRSMVSQEVRSAVEQTDKMMKSLMERIQEMDSEPRFDARIKKLQAHVKKVKRRGDAVFVYIRKHGISEMSQNQQRSLGSLQTLTAVSEMKNISSANGECSGDGTSTSAVIDCEGVVVRKPKDGFWQSLRSKKQIVDLTDEAEACRQNGKRHTDSPLTAQASVQAGLPSKLPPFPDTPFPSQLPLAAATKNLPQKPVVKVARIDNPQGIALLWNVEEEDPHAPDMDCYYIYVTQEHSDGTFCKWKTMGIIKAMPLPMACRVTGRSVGSALHFVIIGKDIYGRYGPYSNIQTVVANKT